MFLLFVDLKQLENVFLISQMYLDHFMFFI